MKKRKNYEISVIDKTYSKTISDETKFYTSDTALELVFKLKETEYTFESAEIVLLNIDDRSLTTRPVAKVNNDFVYELDDDIIPHYGEWRGQLRFEQAGEFYGSSPVKFRIENDLSNDRPPQLSDVQSWVSLKKYADGLVDELKQAVEEAVTNVEAMDDTFKANELDRDKAEKERQSRFEDAEQERQNAELIRVENENQRNLTSVDEFIKLQKAIGGRNLTRGNTDAIRLTASGDNRALMFVDFGVRNFKANTDYTVSLDIKAQKGIAALNYNYMWASSPDTLGNVNLGRIDIIDDGTWRRYSKTFNFSSDRYGEVRLGLDSRQVDVNSNIPFEFSKWKLEEGSVATPYTKAPEDYTNVTKDDYYNHIDLVNDAKNSQFNQLKKAVIALGGTI